MAIQPPPQPWRPSAQLRCHRHDAVAVAWQLYEAAAYGTAYHRKQGRCIPDSPTGNETQEQLQQAARLPGRVPGDGAIR
jgi:hypothetical protein